MLLWLRALYVSNCVRDVHNADWYVSVLQSPEVHAAFTWRTIHNGNLKTQVKWLHLYVKTWLLTGISPRCVRKSPVQFQSEVKIIGEKWLIFFCISKVKCQIHFFANSVSRKQVCSTLISYISMFILTFQNPFLIFYNDLGPKIKFE